MTKATQLLSGHLLEMYAEVGDEKQYIRHTTDDVGIDVSTGAVSFKILFDEDYEGLRTATFLDDENFLTGREYLHGFEIHLYQYHDADSPHTVYRTDVADVNATIHLPIEGDFAYVGVTVTPREPKHARFVRGDSDDENETTPDRDALKITSGNLGL